MHHQSLRLRNTRITPSRFSTIQTVQLQVPPLRLQQQYRVLQSHSMMQLASADRDIPSMVGAMARIFEQRVIQRQWLELIRPLSRSGRLQSQPHLPSHLQQQQMAEQRSLSLRATVVRQVPTRSRPHRVVPLARLLRQPQHVRSRHYQMEPLTHLVPPLRIRLVHLPQ